MRKWLTWLKAYLGGMPLGYRAWLRRVAEWEAFEAKYADVLSRAEGIIEEWEFRDEADPNGTLSMHRPVRSPTPVTDRAVWYYDARDHGYPIRNMAVKS